MSKFSAKNSGGELAGPRRVGVQVTGPRQGASKAERHFVQDTRKHGDGSRTIRQSDLPLIIQDSGVWKAVEDLCGTIKVKADCVTIDLKSHHLETKSKHAIKAKNVKGLQILNGCIDGGTHHYPVQICGADDVKIAGIHFLGCQKERALNITGSAQVSLSQVTASGFQSKDSPIINLSGNDVVLFDGVHVYDSVKKLSVPTGSFPVGFFHNQGLRLVSITKCTGVDLKGLHISKNSSQSSQSRNGYIGLGIEESPGTIVRDSWVKDTSIQDGGDGSTYAMISYVDSNNVVFERVQITDNNTSSVPIQIMHGITGYNSYETRFIDCQVHDNVVQELVVVPQSRSDLDFGRGGFYGIQASLSTATALRCQTNRNRVNDSGSSRGPTDGVVSVLGFAVEGVYLTQDCQANDNYCSPAPSGSFNTACVGFSCNATLDQLYLNCIARGNTGGYFSTGFLRAPASTPQIPPIPELGAHRAKFVNCTGNSNGRYGCLIGIPGLPDGDANGIEIIGSTFINNGVDAAYGLDTAGIYLVPLTNAITDVIIRNTTVSETTQSVSAYGIYIDGAANVLLENNVVSSITNGVGIALLNSTYSKVVGNTVSISAVGYLDTGSDNSYLSNKADGNGTDYQGMPLANMITYNTGTGTFSSPPNSFSNLSLV